MGKSSWYNPFSWGREDPELKTKTIEDPYKTAVSSPLSEFLSSRIGTGLPRYEGPLSHKMGEAEESRYSEFIGMDPEAWFKSKVTDPTMEAWREDVAPVVAEGWAGSLRGSGRFRDVEESGADVAKGLGEIGGKAIPEIYGRQMDTIERYQKMKNVAYEREYADWYKSLPEMNPILGMSLNFLQGPTGRDVLSWVDPGKSGWFSDAIQMLFNIGISGGQQGFGWWGGKKED